MDRLIIGNWKMNGLSNSLEEIASLNHMIGEMGEIECYVVICPPATLIRPSCRLGGAHVHIGGQNCHSEQSGAHTGDISAEMLKDAGAGYVIVGHSERRADCGENDAIVNAKAKAALDAGIIPVICVGESEAERKSGKAIDIVLSQVRASIPDISPDAKIVVAYEPVWAIGTGLVPSLQDIGEMHSAIRQELVKKFGEMGDTIPLLYGGSMKPSNAEEILAVANVNGGLVGGASLKADDFITIIKAAA